MNVLRRAQFGSTRVAAVLRGFVVDAVLAVGSQMLPSVSSATPSMVSLGGTALGEKIVSLSSLVYRSVGSPLGTGTIGAIVSRAIEFDEVNCNGFERL